MDFIRRTTFSVRLLFLFENHSSQKIITQKNNIPVCASADRYVIVREYEKSCVV